MMRSSVMILLCVIISVGLRPAVAEDSPATHRRSADPEQCTLRLGEGGDLQGAIDRMPANGEAATLCLGEGEFRLERYLSIGRDHLTLRGRGTSTVLRLEAGVESPVIVVGDDENTIPGRVISDVTIERLRIIGGGSDGGEFALARPYLTNSVIIVRAGRNIAIRNLEVAACRSACILTEYDTREVRIADNHVSGAVWDGISLNRTSKARLVGNTIRGNTAAGITTEHLEDSIIRGNTLSDNKTHGLYLSDSYRNLVTGNRFSGNVLSGVFLTCAVRHRDPVQCWSDSMSGSNVFERNEFVANRVGYMVGAGPQANCAQPGFFPNLSCADLFSGSPEEDPAASRYGRCLRYFRDGSC